MHIVGSRRVLARAHDQPGSPLGVRRYLPALVPLLALAGGVGAARMARVPQLRPGAFALVAALAAWMLWTAAPSFSTATRARGLSCPVSTR